LEQVRLLHSDTEIAISVVTIAELVHGAYRAKTSEQRQNRLEFID
jgi:predicted nucleic acid-binding protein